MLDRTTTNQNVQKAVAVIRDLSGDEAVREIARKREEAIYTEISKMRGAREEGRKDRGKNRGKRRVIQKSSSIRNKRRHYTGSNKNVKQKLKKNINP